MPVIKFEYEVKSEQTHKLCVEGLLPFLFFELQMTQKERNRIIGTKVTRSTLSRKQLKKIEKKLEAGPVKFFIDSILRVDHYSKEFKIRLTEK